MNKYFVNVTTQYDGYEWVEKQIIIARNEKQVIKNINTPGYFTHNDCIEIIENYAITKLDNEEYKILSKFI